MINLDTKLYVQLQPADYELSVIKAIQDSLTDQTKLVSPASLHLTVIHIGLVSRFVESVHKGSNIQVSEIINFLEDMSIELERVIYNQPIEIYNLIPDSYSRFGKNGSAFVLLFKQDDSLSKLHKQSLKVLQEFLIKMGIHDPKQFMAEDPNLKYALGLKPHLTIAHISNNIENPGLPEVMSFKVMSVIYN